MNIESYVFLICFVVLGIVSLFTVGRLIAVEKELERKNQVIKTLQRVHRDEHMLDEVIIKTLKRELSTLRGEKIDVQKFN